MSDPIVPVATCATCGPTTVVVTNDWPICEKCGAVVSRPRLSATEPTDEPESSPERRIAIEALQRLIIAAQWQPIGTAPDGVYVLICFPRREWGCNIGKHDPRDGAWVDEDGACYTQPTHWMPLPPSPDDDDTRQFVQRSLAGLNAAFEKEPQP